MSERNDGGNAYPTGQWEYDGQGNVLPYQEAGMSLRDAMALSALPAVYAEFWRGVAADEYNVTPGWRDGVAADAYQMADALLAARERT